MKLENKWLTVVAVSLTACTGQAPQESHAGLTASAEAQKFGVASYVIEADAVKLLDAKGAPMGVLTVEDVSNKARTVRVTRPDQPLYEQEVEGNGLPLERAPVEDTLEGRVQLDPALASFFATHQLSFLLLNGTGPSGMRPAVPADQLAPEATSVYGSITFNSSCSALSGAYWSSYNLSYAYTVNIGFDFDWYCDSACGNEIATSSSYYDGNDGYYKCECFSGTSTMYQYAVCFPTMQGCPNGDKVKKHRDCNSSTGVCSNIPDGFQSCY